AGAEVRALDSGYAIIRDDAPAGHIHKISTNEGYNGLITLLVAIDDNETILGVRVTEHRETPGLGDKIEPEVSDWIDQFNGRSLNNTRWTLQPDGDIDGISGATITAKATLEAVRGALAP
ncbi:MAG: RnfABCDGE type electron transport complex subunit G, partial [Gammaproteobacteria bacterium]